MFVWEWGCESICVFVLECMTYISVRDCTVSVAKDSCPTIWMNIYEWKFFFFCLCASFEIFSSVLFVSFILYFNQLALKSHRGTSQRGSGDCNVTPRMRGTCVSKHVSVWIQSGPKWSDFFSPRSRNLTCQSSWWCSFREHQTRVHLHSYSLFLSSVLRLNFFVTFYSCGAAASVLLVASVWFPALYWTADLVLRLRLQLFLLNPCFLNCSETTINNRSISLPHIDKVLLL